jgi:hypothetical protein
VKNDERFSGKPLGRAGRAFTKNPFEFKKTSTGYSRAVKNLSLYYLISFISSFVNQNHCISIVLLLFGPLD